MLADLRRFHFEVEDACGILYTSHNKVGQFFIPYFQKICRALIDTPCTAAGFCCIHLYIRGEIFADGNKSIFLFATGVKFSLFGKTVCNNDDVILSITNGNLSFLNLHSQKDGSWPEKPLMNSNHQKERRFS